MNSRLAEIRGSIKRVDGFLVTDINNVRYLTGFTGSSGFLLITNKENIFVTDFRYKERSEREISGWRIAIQKSGKTQAVLRMARKLGIRRLGFETSVAYEFFKGLSGKGFSLKPLGAIVEKLRAIKNAGEIRLITEAARRAEAAFMEVKPYIKIGARERKIAMMLEERLKKKGCNRIPFDIIVASGRNSAMPHARSSEKKLTAGDLVVIDWGGEAGGYFSDMTRTLLMKGDNLEKKKEIYRTVLEANKKAVSAVKPSVSAKEIDNSARCVIKKAGYGDFFGHGAGHGVGLQVHELPNITRKTRGLIKENMVFTIEPGIYIPDVGGVRIEDMVAVGSKKALLLTKLSRELEVI